MKITVRGIDIISKVSPTPFSPIINDDKLNDRWHKITFYVAGVVSSFNQTNPSVVSQMTGPRERSKSKTV